MIKDMDFPIILNFIFNIFIFLSFIFFMGMGGNSSETANAFNLYMIYAYSLFFSPIPVYFLRKISKQVIIKKILLILSFTYFMWGYILIDIARIPLEPIYNYEKYEILKKVSVNIENIDDMGSVENEKIMKITLNVLNSTKKTFKAKLTLVKKPNIYLLYSSCLMASYTYTKITPGQNSTTFSCRIGFGPQSDINPTNLTLKDLMGKLVLQDTPVTQIDFPLL